MSHATILELRRGRAVPFGPAGEPSAIQKDPVPGPVPVSPLGLEGDMQGDPRRHGGPEKALHAYATEHYDAWRDALPTSAKAFRPGAFGENLVLRGVTEADICLGDQWRIGDVLLEVSQGHQPCWKLNLRFGVADMARQVQDSGPTGWYFRVLAGGMLAPGALYLHDRPTPTWPLSRIQNLLYRGTLNRAELEAFSMLDNAPDSWRKLAQRRLARHAVEDWSARIETP